MVSQPEVAAVAFTGSRKAGLKLKEAADRAGKLFYAEMSSVNPVFFLPDLIREKASSLASELLLPVLRAVVNSCTKPGLAVFIGFTKTAVSFRHLKQVYAEPLPAIFSSPAVQENLAAAIARVAAAGAELLIGGHFAGTGFRI